jgi:hypothetical protein
MWMDVYVSMINGKDQVYTEAGLSVLHSHSSMSDDNTTCRSNRRPE